MERTRQRPGPTGGTPASAPQSGDTTPDVAQDAGGNGVVAARGGAGPGAPAPAPGAPAPEPAATPATPAADAPAPAASSVASHEQQVEEAVKSGNAAALATLVTAPGEVATVAEQLAAAHFEALQTLGTGPAAALWRRPAIAVALRQGKPVAGLVGTPEGKKDAVAEAIAQSKAADLVASGAIASADWAAAMDDAQYLRFIGLLAQPVTGQAVYDTVWRLYGDGEARSGDCARVTFKALFTSKILPVGSVDAWSGRGTSSENGSAFEWRWVYEPVAPNDRAIKVFMVGAKTLPQGQVNSANIAFSATVAKYARRTSPNPNDWTRSGGQSPVTTSYYLGESNTVVMGVDGSGSPGRLDQVQQHTSDGTGTGVGGQTTPGAPALTYFLNHARHEVGHAVGNRTFQGMTETGDNFALAWGGWTALTRDGFASAMWNAGGEVKLTFPPQGEKDFAASEVRDWLVALIADGREPPGNKVSQATGAIAAKIDIIKASSLGAQSLVGYVVAVFEASGKDVARLKERGFRQPGFTPPDPVNIWSSRESPAGFWSFSKAAHDQLKATHGWYSMSSHKEMFAEIYTLKYTSGVLPGPVNGKDPAAFFQQLEASSDSMLMPSGARSGGGAPDAPTPTKASGPGGAPPAGGTPAPATLGQAPTKPPDFSNPASRLGG
ncbi:MAG: hypothetical protein U1F43_29400 [Myxococcota bacterium]